MRTRQVWAVIAALHVLGLGVVVVESVLTGGPHRAWAVFGVAGSAYLLGLRHASMPTMSRR